MTKTTRIYNNRKSGIYIHPYRQVCMGRCRFCRDPEKEPKVLRKRRQQEFIKMLKKEDM